MKKTKFLTCIAALGLILSLGACDTIENTTSPDTPQETTSDEDSPEDTPKGDEGGDTGEDPTNPDEGGDTGTTPGGDDNPDNPGEGSGSTQGGDETTLTDYTLSIAILYDEEKQVVPYSGLAFIQGSWDWTEWETLTYNSVSGEYEYTFSTISVATYEFQLVLGYDETNFGYGYRITQDGNNVKFTITGEEGDGYTNHVEVTSLSPLSDILPDPDSFISDVKVTFDITYGEESQDALSYGTLWIQGSWDSWKDFLACSTEEGKYTYTFSSLAPIEYEFVALIYYTDDELPSGDELWEYQVNDNTTNCSFTVETNTVSASIEATNELSSILPIKGSIDRAYAIVGTFTDGTWDNAPTNEKYILRYSSTDSSTKYWERTITLSDYAGYSAFRIVPYGETGAWTTVINSSHLTADSEGVTAEATGDKNILTSSGVTYDLIIDCTTASAYSIKVSIHHDAWEDEVDTFSPDLSSIPAAVWGQESDGPKTTWTRGNFYYWTGQWDWSCNGAATNIKSEYNADTSAYEFTWSVDVATAVPWVYQIFYTLPAEAGLDVGSSYSMTLYITVDFNGTITFTNNNVKNAVTVTEGLNKITLNNLVATETSDLSICVGDNTDGSGGYAIQSGTIGINYLGFTYESSTTVEGFDLIFTITNGATPQPYTGYATIYYQGSTTNSNWTSWLPLVETGDGYTYTLHFDDDEIPTAGTTYQYGLAMDYSTETTNTQAWTHKVNQGSGNESLTLTSGDITLGYKQVTVDAGKDLSAILVDPNADKLVNVTLQFNITQVTVGYDVYLWSSFDGWTAWLPCTYNETTGYWEITFETIDPGYYEYIVCLIPSGTTPTVGNWDGVIKTGTGRNIPITLDLSYSNTSTVVDGQ